MSGSLAFGVFNFLVLSIAMSMFIISSMAVSTDYLGSSFSLFSICVHRGVRVGRTVVVARGVPVAVPI